MRLDMTWGQAAQATRGELARGKTDAPFRGLSIDSRKVGPREAFWALKGERFDAHDFLNAELAGRCDGWVVRSSARLPESLPKRLLRVPDTRQALADLAAFHRGRFSIPVAGITGSNGKTTVKEMLRAVLSVRGEVCAGAGNLNNEIGVPLSVLELGAGHRWGVFEMGASRPGDIRYLCAVVRPTVGVLTNIQPAHIEFFGGIEGVFRTKSELIDGLPPGAPVVLNRDDAFLARHLPKLGPRAVTFGRGADADVRAEPGSSPDAVRLHIRGKAVEARLPAGLGGGIQRLNAAAAAAAACALGLAPEEIAEGLGRFQPAPLRFARRRHAGGAEFVVDAYNANPASMRAGIETFLESFPEGRRFVVLGDMKELGAEEARYHRELGGWLSGLPLAGAFLAGPLMAHAAEALKSASFKTKHAPEAALLIEDLRAALDSGAAVYFKASRAMRLEELAEKL